MILAYLLKSVIISGILSGYYLLFLKNRRFHGFNRLFLLSIPAVGFLLPLCRFELPVFFPAHGQSTPIRLLQVVQGEMEQTVTVYANRPVTSWFTWQNGLPVLSIGITMFLFFRLLAHLRYLRRLARRSVVQRISGADLCLVEAEGTPFSFFRRIFWNPAIDIQSPAGRQILQHELCHVRRQHSLDILWLESIGIVAWFNPFLYLVRKELMMIHEFMADADAAADPVEYAGLLLKHQAEGVVPSGLTHSFFHHPLKRRIIMLTKISNQKNKITGRLLLLPLLAILTGLFAFKTSWHPLSLTHPFKKIRIVLDPGHGGVNQGPVVNGVKEEDMNLAIAKKIREVAKTYDVDVILTREGDNTPEPGQTLRSSLEYRAKLAADQKADAFISIHMNSNGDAAEKISGFQIFISKKGSGQYEQSMKLGSSVNSSIAKDYKTAVDLKEREKGVYVLDQAQVPAILVECGSLDVKEDMEFMSLPGNQEKIARDILEGVVKFTSASTGYVDGPQPRDPNASGVEPAIETIELSEIKTDTVTKTQMYALDQKDIRRMDVSREEKKVLITMKSGDRHVYLIPANEATAIDSMPALKKVEVESEYPGGAGAWQKYLQATLNYPQAAVDKAVQGTVLVEFIVKKDGTVDPKDVKVKSGPKPLRAESLRVIRASGNWIPAQDHGVAVNAYKIQPISYKLEVQ